MDTAQQAALLMRSRNIRAVAVVDGSTGIVAGILTHRDGFRQLPVVDRDGRLAGMVVEGQ